MSELSPGLWDSIEGLQDLTYIYMTALAVPISDMVVGWRPWVCWFFLLYMHPC